MSVPRGPMIASAVVIAVGCAYLVWTSPGVSKRHAGTTPAPDAGVLRVAAWDVGRTIDGAWRPLADEDAPAVAAALASITPHAVALQGVADRAQAERVAAALGGDWTTVVVPRAADAADVLAVLVGPALELRNRALIETPVGAWALAATLSMRSGRTVRLISLRAEALGNSERSRYLSRVIDWCEEHHARVDILAGRVGLIAGRDDATTDSRASTTEDATTARRLAERFFDATPPGASHQGERPAHGALYVGPRGVSVRGSTVVDRAEIDGVDDVPVVVDLLP